MQTPAINELYSAVIHPIFTFFLIAFGTLGWVSAFMLNRDLSILEKRLGKTAFEWLLNSEREILYNPYVEGLKLCGQRLNEAVLLYLKFIRIMFRRLLYVPKLRRGEL